MLNTKDTKGRNKRFSFVHPVVNTNIFHHTHKKNPNDYWKKNGLCELTFPQKQRRKLMTLAKLKLEDKKKNKSQFVNRKFQGTFQDIFVFLD